MIAVFWPVVAFLGAPLIAWVFCKLFKRAGVFFGVTGLTFLLWLALMPTMLQFLQFLVVISTAAPAIAPADTLQAMHDSPYKQEIYETAVKHGLDPLMWDAQVDQESRYNPKAVSSAGAMGLAQIMPGTWKWRNCKGDHYNPIDNLECGASLMAWLLDRYSGNYDLALAAYNWGAGNVDGCLCIGTGEPTIYVNNITAGYESRIGALSASLASNSPNFRQVSEATAGFTGFSRALPESPGDCETIVPIYSNGILTQGAHGFSYGHAALDYAGGEGVPVYSPINGTVTEYYIDEYSNTTLLIENDCYAVILLHGEWDARPGDRVAAGDQIGVEGNNGYTMNYLGQLCNGRSGCGDHTHWNTYSKKQGVNIDPRDYMK